MRSRAARHAAGLLTAMQLAACVDPTGPLPSGAEAFEPPRAYARWWALTEACSGTSASYRAVTWYRAPGASILHQGRELAGFWRANGNAIVLADEHVYDGPTVRHEMLHAILRRPGHPREQFLEACSALLRCQGSCIADAGQWKAPVVDAVTLPPDSLTIASTVELLPADADGHRWLGLWVTVTNARAASVIVAAPGDPVTPPTFGFDLRGPPGAVMGSEVAADSSVLYFEPGATKRWLFEFRVGVDPSLQPVTPGEYRVRGTYARGLAPFDTIVVAP